MSILVRRSKEVRNEDSPDQPSPAEAQNPTSDRLTPSIDGATRLSKALTEEDRNRLKRNHSPAIR